MRLFLASLVLTTLLAPAVRAEDTIVLHDFRGSIKLSATPAPFSLIGQVAPLGLFKARGEVTFPRGLTEAASLGEGVIVLRVANGDQLVGITSWTLGPVRGEIRSFLLHVSWRPSVQFADGTIAHSTGRFALDLPVDMTANGIIAILIGLMTPP
jgi:hypothetical protein